MFCSKCGTKAIDGAVFCQKCGARLIQDKSESTPNFNTNKILATEDELIQVCSSEPQNTITTPIEPITKTVQETDIHEDVPLISGGDTDVYAFLKDNAGMCTDIKSAKQIKTGICLKGKMHSHFVSLVSGQARISTTLAFPFSILQGLPVGLLVYIVAGCTWDFMDYGLISFEDYALPFALCLLIIGVLTAIMPYIGRREKASVREYVQKTVEGKNIALAADERKPVRFVIAAAFLIAGVLVFLFGVLDIELGGPEADPESGLEAEDIYGSYEPDGSAAVGAPGEAADDSVFGEALIQLITYNTLPDGNIANDLDGKTDGMYDQFAICDIDQNGEKELLIYISSGSMAASGLYVYGLNAAHTGLEYVWSFGTKVTFYDTGFVKEEWSHNQGLANNFWPYSIYQRTDEGYSEAGSADAWEKAYMEYDFSGNPFPEAVDSDGNGIVYFISDENGIDYDHPVDDAEYKEFERGFFGNADGIYVPWQSLELEKIKAATDIDGTEDIYGENGKVDLRYGEISPIDLLHKSTDEVRSILGYPTDGTPVNGELLFGGTEYYVYDGLVLYFDSRTDTVANISIRSDLVKNNGETLDKNRTELINLLGQPTYEGYYHDEMGESDDYYYLQYTLYQAATIIDVEMPDPDGKAYTVVVYEYDDGPGDDYWDEPYEDNSASLGYGFEWVEMPYADVDQLGLNVIKGVIENKSGSTQDTVLIYFNLYDADGYLIDYASDSIQNVKNGDKWKFQVTILNQDAAYWEFAYISVY